MATGSYTNATCSVVEVFESCGDSDNDEEGNWLSRSSSSVVFLLERLKSPTPAGIA